MKRSGVGDLAGACRRDRAAPAGGRRAGARAGHAFDARRPGHGEPTTGVHALSTDTARGGPGASAGAGPVRERHPARAVTGQGRTSGTRGETRAVTPPNSCSKPETGGRLGLDSPPALPAPKAKIPCPIRHSRRVIREETRVEKLQPCQMAHDALQRRTNQKRVSTTSVVFARDSRGTGVA